jgi:hypothetical protein
LTTISNTTFYSNSAPSGGGIYKVYGILNLTNSTLDRNAATGSGAGVYQSGGTAYITNTTFVSNTAANGAGGYISGTVTINNSTFNGSAATNGGGIYKSGGTLNVNSSTLSSNSAPDGGGVYISAGTSTFVSTTLKSNYASVVVFGSGHGGGMHLAGGTTNFLNGTFSGNSASGAIGSGKGGGMYITGTLTSVWVTNSTIANNSVFSLFGGEGGGGIRHVSGALNVLLSTLAGNRASLGAGGAISNTGSVTFTNSIVANNTASTAGNCSGTVIDGGNNLQWNPNSDCGFALAAGDPKLALLANYGGPTQTMALQTGSAALDVTNTWCLPTDQRGYPRPFNSVCDLGAFEGIGHPLFLPLILK